MNFHLNKLVFMAQKGDPYARMFLLARNRSFVRRTASDICDKKLKWDIDIELEVALNAFDYAIDKYTREMDYDFLDFAREVIYIHIHEFFIKKGKQESLNKAIILDKYIVQLLNGGLYYNNGESIEDLCEKYKEVLKDYGVSYDELLGKKEGQADNDNYIKVLIQRARLALRRYWNDFNNDEI
ncbi:MAG: hypothetical protein ACOY46_18010 [Bacillota bacterium]